MRHYEEPDTYPEIVCKFARRHIISTFIVGIILGFILKPIFIGLVFLIWLLCVAWGL